MRRGARAHANLSDFDCARTAHSGIVGPLFPPHHTAPSSSGLGRGPLKAETRVRVPLGPPILFPSAPLSAQLLFEGVGLCFPLAPADTVAHASRPLRISSAPVWSGERSIDLSAPLDPHEWRMI